MIFKISYAFTKLIFDKEELQLKPTEYINGTASQAESRNVQFAGIFGTRKFHALSCIPIGNVVRTAISAPNNISAINIGDEF